MSIYFLIKKVTFFFRLGKFWKSVGVLEFKYISLQTNKRYPPPHLSVHFMYFVQITQAFGHKTLMGRLTVEKESPLRLSWPTVFGNCDTLNKLNWYLKLNLVNLNVWESKFIHYMTPCLCCEICAVSTSRSVIFIQRSLDLKKVIVKTVCVLWSVSDLRVRNILIMGTL